MMERVRKYHQTLLIVLMVVCMGIIMVGGVQYVGRLRRNLQHNTLQNLMTVTTQQQQAFDTFIREDQEEVHSFTKFFTSRGIDDPEQVRQLLSLPDDTEAIYLTMCLDDGWICGTSFDDIRQLDPENLEIYRALGGVGVRDSYTGLYSGTPRFGYYETFTFPNGHRGLVQKSYDRSEVLESFSLAFYNGQGLSCIVNRQGNVLLRPDGAEDFYENIFDQLLETSGDPETVARLKEDLSAGKIGNIVLSGDEGELIYTYIPVQSVEGWYLVSFVPAEAVTVETNQMLLEFQLALGIMLLLLFICAVFILLICRTQQELLAKDRAIDYQTQLFDSFTSYLSGNTDDIYMIFDTRTEQLDYVSPNVTRVLGVEPEEVLDALYAQDMAADAGAAEAYYAEVHALTPGQSARSRNTERVNAVTGEHRYFLENSRCVLIQGTAKRVGCLSDRTRERKAQNDLAEALHMAQAANAAKSAFLSSVSHDIRTPMNAIIGFLALMRNEADNPAMVLEYNKRIDSASQHLLGLINDVLDMNKIESGSATLNLTELELAAVIEEINTIIRPQARAKNQTFTIVAPPVRHEHLQGDKLRINQILINLLSNAVKYTQAGGTITMRVEELSQVVDSYSRIRFTVSDNGMGMSEEYQKVLFDPFTREETKAACEIQGTGLGMAITKSLVDLMGGSIHVESEPGRGSTFTVELELYIQEKEDDPQFWTDHSVARIIVTDDDEDVCKGIVKTLSRAGVAADYATDGHTAVRMMRENREAGRPYDVILLDWKMPDLNGLETARLIRKNYSQKIPILLLTAYDWSEIEDEAMEIGVSHFLPKPFFMSSFKSAIRRVMGSQKKPEQLQDNAVQGMNILVVDDIEVNQIILVKILSTLGASCDVAGNGQEAVEKFETSRPGTYDLILMDVQMPVMDGYAATRAIRTSSHPSAGTVPVIAMTANAFVDDVRDALASGMDAHIAKPVQIETLKATIRQVMDSRRGQA